MFEKVNYTNNYFQKAYILFVAYLHPKSDMIYGWIILNSYIIFVIFACI